MTGENIGVTEESNIKMIQLATEENNGATKENNIKMLS